MMDWMICMLILSSLWLIFGFDLHPCQVLDQLWTCLWVVSVLVVYLMIWSRSTSSHLPSCFNFAFQVGFSLSAPFWLMSYELKVVLSPRVWSFSLLFAWNIHYRRIPKMVVLTMVGSLVLSLSKSSSCLVLFETLFFFLNTIFMPCCYWFLLGFSLSVPCFCQFGSVSLDYLLVLCFHIVPFVDFRLWRPLCRFVGSWSPEFMKLQHFVTVLVEYNPLCIKKEKDYHCNKCVHTIIDMWQDRKSVV